MKGSAKVLTNSRLLASGQDIGFIEDCLFGEQSLRLHYLVATLERAHDRRQVLISTDIIGAIDWSAPALQLSIDLFEVEKLPALDLNASISRYRETPLKRFRWPFFFTGAGTFGVEGFPEPVEVSPEDDIGFGHNLRSINSERPAIEDRHLRSTRDIGGYRIHASNEVFGHVEDFIFDIATWRLKALVVNAQNWWSAKCIEIDPKDIQQISWEKSEVLVKRKKEHLVGAPYTEANTSL